MNEKDEKNLHFKTKNKNWWLWCLLWAILAWSGFEGFVTSLSLSVGGGVTNLILIGICVYCFFYEMYTNSDTYIEENNAKVRKSIEEAKRAKERAEILDVETRMSAIYARFGRLDIVNDVVKQLCYEEANNHFGVTVRCSKIEVGYKTWKFNDYGYNNLDLKSCKDLTYYFIYLFKKQSRFKVREVTRMVGGYNPVNAIIDSIAIQAGSYRSDDGPGSVVDGYASYDTIPVTQTRKNI